MQELFGISIHAPLAGCDLAHERFELLVTHFNPRTPCGVRLRRLPTLPPSRQFQSTHPLRGATAHFNSFLSACNISIHAPLAGCDLKAEKADAELAISIHAPLAGCDSKIRFFASAEWISIHAPLAGCDLRGRRKERQLQNFNPRTPCGVRRLLLRAFAGGLKFQSTHPLRGATLYLVPNRDSHHQQRADSLKNKYYQFKINKYAF